jgi:hypothetical protein
MAALVVAILLATPGAQAVTTGYNLSYSAPPGAVTDGDVDLVGVGSQDQGSSVQLTVTTHAPMAFCCDHVYEAYLGGTKSTYAYYPDNYTGYLLAPLNNTTWFGYSYYPASGNDQYLWIEGSMGPGNLSFSIVVPKSLVPASGNFSLEANAEFANYAGSGGVEYTWLGTFLDCWGIGSQGNCTEGTGSPSGASSSALSPLLFAVLLVAIAVAAVVVAVLVIAVFLPRRRGRSPPGTSSARYSPPAGPPPGAR